MVVLVLQVNLRNEYLGASAFDVPTFVASDLFSDEVETLRTLKDTDDTVTAFTTTPMLRGSLTAINGKPVEDVRPRGPEASFLLSGEVPMTFRQELPSSSRVIAGEWWPSDYQGPALVSLHQSLRAGLGVNVGDQLPFRFSATRSPLKSRAFATIPGRAG